MQHTWSQTNERAEDASRAEKVGAWMPDVGGGGTEPGSQ
jgi:hypothetical protein